MLEKIERKMIGESNKQWVFQDMKKRKGKWIIESALSRYTYE
jgi:phosphodiesterase/alkaline phosphatase D-like protein